MRKTATKIESGRCDGRPRDEAGARQNAMHSMELFGKWRHSLRAHFCIAEFTKCLLHRYP